jgi:hypothetical protein
MPANKSIFDEIDEGEEERAIEWRRAASCRTKKW